MLTFSNLLACDRVDLFSLSSHRQQKANQIEYPTHTEKKKNILNFYSNYSSDCRDTQWLRGDKHQQQQTNRKEMCIRYVL